MNVSCRWLCNNNVEHLHFFFSKKGNKNTPFFFSFLPLRLPPPFPLPFSSVVKQGAMPGWASITAPDPSSALWRGDFMSELLIITGDCILTFSPEIHKRQAQRPPLAGSFPPPAGNVCRSEVKGNLLHLLCITLSSLRLGVFPAVVLFLMWGSLQSKLQVWSSTAAVNHSKRSGYVLRAALHFFGRRRRSR